MSLEAEFDAAMHEIFSRAKTEAGYTASAFLKMLYERRGVSTAKALINSPKPSDGYTRLYEKGRLDLTVEALLVENQRWHPLFSPSEIESARARLKQYQYERL